MLANANEVTNRRTPPSVPPEAVARRLWIVGTSALFVEARFRGVTLAARLLRAEGRVTFAVGATADADAPVNPAYLPSASEAHALIEPGEGGFILNLTPAMAAEVWGELEAPPLPAQQGGGDEAIALDPGTTLRVCCGEVWFDVQAADPVSALPRPWLPVGWGDEAPYPIGVGMLLLALLGVVRAIPGDPRSLSLDDLGASTRFDRVLIKPPEVKPPDNDNALGWLRHQGGSGAPAAAGPSGSAGKPDAKPRAAHVALRGDPTAHDAASAAAEVRSHTILAMLDGSRSSALAAALSPGRTFGNQMQEVLANLDGTDLLDAYGHGGFGPAGTGEKGGGTGEGTIGGGGRLATYGRFGHGGPGVGVGDRYGVGAGLLGTHRTRVPEVIASIATVRGSLDKDIIRRIVRRHLNEVRYCYDEGLARKPGLSGRLVVQFTIAPTGNVLASALASSSLASVPVEACVVNAVKRWAFPAPSGGGLVIVSYPFEMTPAGGS
jgi:TonB family protein